MGGTPAHPHQNQYMWTLKMHVPGIHTVRVQQNIRSTRLPILWSTLRIFRGSDSPSSPGKPHLNHKSRKNFDGPRIPVPQGECAAFNARLDGKYEDQSAHLLCASVHPRTFLLCEHTHRLVLRSQKQVGGYHGRAVL
jgi:hypothetical protein